MGTTLLRDRVAAALELFVPQELRELGIDRVRQARLCVAFAWIAGITGLVALVSHLIRGSTWIAFAFGAGILCSAATPFVLRRSASLVLAGNLLTFAWFSSTGAAAILRGGPGAPSITASLISPLLATLLAGRRSGVAWGIGSLLWLAALVVALETGFEFPNQVPVKSRASLTLATGMVFTLLMVLIGMAYEHLKDRALEDQRHSAEEARREHEARLRAETEAKVMFADRMASIGRLSAGVAHEINNPLAYVLINLEHISADLKLQDPPVSPELTQAIDDALHGAQRIRSIVGDLRTFARVEDGQVSSIDVHRTLDSTLRMVAGEAGRKARLVKGYGEVPPVLASESSLAQVFLNVLLNAVQAIPEGRQNQEIRVTTRYDGTAVSIQIRDTGVGIAPEVLGRVMEPFFTTKPVGAGTGLGLSVSRNLVERFGGKIEISSTPGLGTIVTINLPSSEGLYTSPPAPPADVPR